MKLFKYAILYGVLYVVVLAGIILALPLLGILKIVGADINEVYDLLTFKIWRDIVRHNSNNGVGE